MLLAYIENGNTTFYDIPDDSRVITEIKENTDFVNKHDLSPYLIGHMYTSLHSKNFLEKMPIDMSILVINNYKKYLIDKEITMKLFEKIEKQLTETLQEEPQGEKRIIAYEIKNEYRLFSIDENIDRRNKNEYYRKCYVNTFAVSAYTNELLSSMQVELMANKEEVKTAVKM